MTRKTVGQEASDLLIKTPDTRDPIELQREMQKDYEKNVHECIERGKKEFYNQDFFVVVETKKERAMKNVIRNYFFCRKTCPTPTYDNTVYHYHNDGEYVEFLWVIPSKDTCELLKDNALQVHKDEKELLDYVLSFSDGTLLRLAKKLNGETSDSIILEK